MTQEDLSELLSLPEHIEVEVDTDLVDEWFNNAARLMWTDSVRERYPAGVLKSCQDARKYVGTPIELRLVEAYGNHTWRVTPSVITCHVAGGKGLEYKTYKLYYAHNAAGKIERYEETLDTLERSRDPGCDLEGFDLVMQRVAYKILK